MEYLHYRTGRGSFEEWEVCDPSRRPIASCGNKRDAKRVADALQLLDAAERLKAAADSGGTLGLPSAPPDTQGGAPGKVGG